MYQTSLLLKKTRVWNSEPLQNALRSLRNPVQMVWSLSVVPVKFSGLTCASYGAQAWDVHHHVSSAPERRYIVTFKLTFCVQKYMFESKSLSTDPSSCDDLKNWVLTYGTPEGSSVALRCDDSVSCLILPCHHCSSLCTESLLSSAALLQ
ncbi:unnamed protein product [Sphagnum jensenii]|uniref:Uncharacterized protein n=1 Tax=Sphagnum jensenii TaxID=128206 RepID=A0ABP1AYV0_9BRYO